MENTPNAVKEKKGRSIALRILAAVLALVLLFSVTVTVLVRVAKPRQKTVSLDLVEEAYAQLSEDDSYLNAPVTERIGQLFSTIGVTPSSLSDYEQLASMYIGRGNYEEARYMYEKAAALLAADQEVALANLYYKLGSICVLCGDMPAAEEYYGRVLAYGISSKLIHVLMAQVYLEQEKYSQAAQQLSMYLVYEPDDAENRRLYANVLEVSGDTAGAVDQYQILYDAGGSPDVCLDIARASLQSEDYTTVISYLTKYLQTNADTDGSLHCMRGMALLWTGEHTKAIDDLVAAEQLGYDDADGSLHYMRGVAYLGAEEYEKGDADLLKAVELGYANRADCYLQLSLSAYMRGNYEQTIAYGTLSRQHTDTPDAELLQRMGLSEMQLQQYDLAMEDLQLSLAADPSLVLNHYFIATLYFLQEDFVSAFASYSAAIAGDVYAQECLYNRALCSLQMEKHEDAINDLLAALVGDDQEITDAARDILSQLGVRIP